MSDGIKNISTLRRVRIAGASRVFSNMIDSLKYDFSFSQAACIFMPSPGKRAQE